MKPSVSRTSFQNLVVMWSTIFLLVYFAVRFTHIDFHAPIPGSTSNIAVKSRNFIKKSPTLKCISIMDVTQTVEGIGAVVRRNQLATFLAETYDALLAWPKLESQHGYDYQGLFGTCPKPAKSCIVHQNKTLLVRCARGDCVCHRAETDKYVESMAARCSVIGVVNDGMRSMEYSGCIRNTMSRYMVPPNRTRALDYDAIHLRAGDLADLKGGKAYSPFELKMILDFMCADSDRDIVIVTEGTPAIPITPGYEHRIVYASDTSLEDAFGIFNDAKNVAVGMSSFAILLMEVASPLRVITQERAVNRYTWVECERWGVVGRTGPMFLFDSKQLMLEAALSGVSLESRTLLTKDQISYRNRKVEFWIPLRTWTNDGTWVKSRGKPPALRN